MNLSRAAAVLAVLLAVSVPGVERPEAAAGAAQPNAAEALLQKARHAVGGRVGLSTVRTLAVDARRVWANGQSTEVGFRLALPDRYQLRTGTAHHTLSADRFWQRFITPAVTERVARENTTSNFIQHSLIYLLTLPPMDSLAIAPEGTTSVGGQQVDVLRITRRDEVLMKLMLDAKSARLVGFTTRPKLWLASGAQGPETEREVRIVRFRRVDGIEFPAQLDEKINGSQASIFVDSIQVNAPDTDQVLTRR